VPVLLFHGDVDQNVKVTESRLMASRLKSAGKSVEYFEFAGLDHKLRDAAARTRLLAQSDAFLRKALELQEVMRPRSTALHLRCGRAPFWQLRQRKWSSPPLCGGRERGAGVSRARFATAAA
jgi:hypothetical protein